MNDSQLPQDAKSLSKARYAQFAEGYVSSETHARGSDLQRLLALAQPQPHWQSLDVATGGGHTALKFAPHVAHVVASDLTARMLARARHFIIGQRKQRNVRFCLADAEDLPFAPRVFDLVTCRIAPHHFPDLPRFLRACARVLRAGGILILQDHVLPPDEDAALAVDAFERLRDPSHHRAYCQDDWLALCRAAGFTIEAHEHFIKRHHFLDWAHRQGNPPATIAALVRMMLAAPPAARAWLDPQGWGSADASFVNRHILIRARVS